MSSISPTHPPVQHGITDWAPVAVRHTVTHLLDPGCFASWLHAQPPERLLYDDDTASRCVLATYLHDEGMVGVTVSASDCYVDGLNELGPVDLPPWARAFVWAIDRSNAYCRDEVVAVFEEALKDIADRDRPMAFEDWQTNKVVA